MSEQSKLSALLSATSNPSAVYFCLLSARHRFFIHAGIVMMFEWNVLSINSITFDASIRLRCGKRTFSYSLRYGMRCGISISFKSVKLLLLRQENERVRKWLRAFVHYFFLWVLRFVRIQPRLISRWNRIVGKSNRLPLHVKLRRGEGHFRTFLSVYYFALCRTKKLTRSMVYAQTEAQSRVRRPSPFLFYS